MKKAHHTVRFHWCNIFEMTTFQKWRHLVGCQGWRHRVADGGGVARYPVVLEVISVLTVVVEELLR